MLNWPAGKWKWLLTGAASLTGGGSLLLHFEIKDLRKKLHPPMSVLEREKLRAYVYIRPDQFHLFKDRNWAEKGIREISSEVHDYVISHIPPGVAKFLPRSVISRTELPDQRYLSPWKLLQQASLSNTSLHPDIVDKIAKHKWQNYEYRLLGQNLEACYLYSLARTKDVDERFFIPPRPLAPLKDEKEIELMLYDLLTKLPQHDVESCLRFFTQGALAMSDERQLKMGGRWCFGGNGLNYTREIVPQQNVESFCLQALVKHSKIPNHCEAMVKLGVLELLQRIRLLRPDGSKIQRNTIRIISNICVHENLHPYILNSGWLSYLVKLSKSDHCAVRMQASRALANLDRKSVEEKYMDGVYLINPRHRTEDEPEADLVLIHGLLGGAFYSWRQQESNSIVANQFTNCWPETWLPKDLPKVRVVCVEYDTHLSDWMPHCPHEKKTRTISYRSQAILDKLKAAGVGEKRPVVWIAHSMGGLVLKNMLTIASENPDKYEGVLENTKGVVFYSTPHFGSRLAEYSRKVRRLLFPSIEVMALSHDSPQLLQLNNGFKTVVQDHGMHVLSFGELQPTNIGLGKYIKLQIVSPESADPGIGTVILCDSDHLNVCKPVSRHSAVYHHTVEFVKSCLAKPEEKDISSKVEDVIEEIMETFL